MGVGVGVGEGAQRGQISPTHDAIIIDILGDSKCLQITIV